TRVVGLRSIGLRSGIRSILQDPNTRGLAQETARFWRSGITRSATDGDSSPTSLDALTFATAALSSAPLDLPRNVDQAKAVIANAPLNAHFKEVLTGLSDRALCRGTTIHDELAQHFDATMEKVSRWYRHWTQGISFAFAIAFTVYLNANTLDLLHQLTAHPETRLELAKLQLRLSDDEGRADAMKNAKAAEALIVKDTLGGGTNWPDGNRDRLRVLCGLFITVLAVSLGAPFWFDVLARINARPGSTDRPPPSISVQPIPAPAPRAPEPRP
ncbi:MAG: hypothetical protein JWN43_4699, partial [Gammaproteobacteria bacterium]|nr:hypothetical protein [Gammaproteobacteria bacterium]